MVSAALLTAERELGRLMAMLSPTDDWRLWRADARRREAIASIDLDGRPVHWQDAAKAGLDPAHLPPAQRAGVGDVMVLMSALRDMSDDLMDSGTDAGATRAAPCGTRSIERDTVAAVAGARQAVADIDRFLDEIADAGGAGRQSTESGACAPAGAGRRSLDPLSGPWLEAVWQRITATGAPLDVSAILTAISTGLEKPGLAGVASALYALHQPGLFPLQRQLPNYAKAALPAEMVRVIEAHRAETDLADTGWRFARTITPWLIQRACGLDSIGPWLSWSIRGARAHYGSGDRDRWNQWIYDRMAQAFAYDLRRLAEIKGVLSSWNGLLSNSPTAAAGRGAPATSRRPARRWTATREALTILVEQPAITSDWLAHRLGVSRRAAQLTMRQWRSLRIIQSEDYGPSDISGRPPAWGIASRLEPKAL